MWRRICVLSFRLVEIRKWWRTSDSWSYGKGNTVSSMDRSIDPSRPSFRSLWRYQWRIFLALSFLKYSSSVIVITSHHPANPKLVVLDLMMEGRRNSLKSCAPKVIGCTTCASKVCTNSLSVGMSIVNLDRRPHPDPDPPRIDSILNFRSAPIDHHFAAYPSRVKMGLPWNKT